MRNQKCEIGNKLIWLKYSGNKDHVILILKYPVPEIWQSSWTS